VNARRGRNDSDDGKKHNHGYKMNIGLVIGDFCFSCFELLTVWKFLESIEAFIFFL
jgi:coenzyme F420-reducing hydrogenase beta subunit